MDEEMEKWILKIDTCSGWSAVNDSCKVTRPICRTGTVRKGRWNCSRNGFLTVKLVTENVLEREYIV